MVSDLLAMQLACGGLVIFGLAMVRLGRKKKEKAADINEAETSAIGDLSPGDGPVQIEGVARPVGETTYAPMVDAEAVHAEAVVQRYRRNRDDGREGWVNTHKTTDSRPFVVEDDTGAALIEDTDDAQLELDREKTAVGRGDVPPEPVRRLLRTIDGVSAKQHRRRRYMQGAIEPGEEVYVYASVAATDADPGDVRLTGDDGEFVVSDISEAAVVSRTSGEGSELYLVGGFLIFVGVVLGTLVTLFGG